MPEIEGNDLQGFPELLDLLVVIHFSALIMSPTRCMGTFTLQ
jgi:hypothetical protein